MPSIRVDVEPDILRWAITRAGLVEDDFPNVDAWLRNEKRPTLKQLESFAKKATVPLGYLFLETPPNEELPVPDYRTRTGEAVPNPSANLLDTLFEMEHRKLWMSEYLSDLGHSKLSLVGSASIGDDVSIVARDMRATLGLDKVHDLPATWRETLPWLRERIEKLGILIFINGIVGNNTSRVLSADEFQGFVLIDQIAPLIFVNGADYKVAQVFTIAHELAHVWTGQSGLFDLDALQSGPSDVETYCNALARIIHEFGI
jgi:hypothetical protein